MSWPCCRRSRLAPLLPPAWAVATWGKSFGTPSRRTKRPKIRRAHLPAHSPRSRRSTTRRLLATTSGRSCSAVETKANANRLTEIAVLLLLLTMTRTVELRAAWWTEVDLGRAEWRIPPERMKMQRPLAGLFHAFAPRRGRHIRGACRCHRLGTTQGWRADLGRQVLWRQRLQPRARQRRTDVDIYQSSFGGGFNQYGGGVGGSTMAAGSVNFRFRCGQ